MTPPRAEQTIVSERIVLRVVDSIQTLEGAGFLVHRSFPTRILSDFDPFLLLDEMGPSDHKPGEAKGAPDHPHRGFETVTYLLDGGLEHKDSQGNSGRLSPGDVQWMTAGAGVIHSELPSAGLLAKGGRFHAFQLWVNLPRVDKMIRPHYQEIKGKNIPFAASSDGRVTVRVIAGDSMGKKAVIKTRTPISYLHFIVSPGGDVRQPIPTGHNTFAYVFEGSGQFGPDKRVVRAHQMVVFDGGGENVHFTNPTGTGQPLHVLLIAGRPLKEPVVRYGPFVMNTEQEIVQAIEDYHSGRLGSISAT